MKVAVYGAGGVGGYFGARLAEGGSEVHLIARGAHLDALRQRGLQVESVKGELRLRLPATDDPREIGASDVVLFCVKSTDTESAARGLAPLLKEDTAVVTLQNGVDNESILSKAIPPVHVVGGVAYILATLSAPGVVSHQGELARIVFGELDGRRSARLGRLLDACRSAGIDAELSVNIRTELWRKLAVICATAGMTAAVRLPLGDIRRSSAALDMYRRIVEEVMAVAQAEGISMAQDTVSRVMALVPRLPGEWYSSLHYDMTRGKPMEIEALHGAVVRSARRAGIEVPMNEAVYAILEPWARRNRARL